MKPATLHRLPLQLRPPPRPLSRSPVVQRAARTNTRSPHSRRNFHASRVTCQDDPNPGHVYRIVHASPKFFTWNRLGLAATYMVGSYVIFEYLAGRMLEDVDLADLEDEDERSDDAGDATRAENADSYFIPLQFPSLLPRKFYRQSDPDWQDFASFSQDTDRKAFVRQELATKVGQDVIAAPRMKKALGDDLQTGRVWLDFKYPDHLPPEYSRLAIEIAPSYAALVEQVIPHAQYVQVKEVLWPRAAFQAGKSSTVVFFHCQLLKLKRLFGYPLSAIDRAVDDLRRHELKRRQLAYEEQGERDDGTPPPTTTLSAVLPGRVASAPQPPVMDASAKPSLANVLFSPDLPSFASFQYLPRLSVPIDFAIASRMFAHVFTQRWPLSRADLLPKGCILVLGHVEIMGTRGRCKVEVHAAYNPRTSDYAYVLCQVKLYWEMNQAAKGGP